MRLRDFVQRSWLQSASTENYFRDFVQVLCMRSLSSRKHLLQQSLRLWAESTVQLD